MLHNQLPDGFEAISINSGTVFHTEQETDEVRFGEWAFVPQYEEDAYVTKRDWRKLTQQEIRCLQSNDNRKDHNTIYVGDIPTKLRKQFEQFDLYECKNREEVLRKFRESPEKTHAMSKAMDEFLQPLSGGKPFHFHCLAANLPNIEMVACDTTSMPADHSELDKKYMGIHNDGTQYVTPYATHKLGNRLTINLGKDTRSFLFVNLSLTQALNMLKKKIDVVKHQIDIINISKYFFKYFPDYPVIKIRQKPYQYYIAPTDNCFHDGSTLGNKELDIIIVYFGAFQC